MRRFSVLGVALVSSIGAPAASVGQGNSPGRGGGGELKKPPSTNTYRPTLAGWTPGFREKSQGGAGSNSRLVAIDPVFFTVRSNGNDDLPLEAYWAGNLVSFCDAVVLPGQVGLAIGAGFRSAPVCNSRD